MAATIVQLCAQLRCGVDADDTGGSQQALYEHWLSREQWRLVEEAVPLIIGVDPNDWPQYVTLNGLEQHTGAFATMLAADFGCGLDGSIDSAALHDWSRRAGVSLPGACEHLLGYIVSVLPAVATATTAPTEDDSAASEREQILGAALALVTRFPAQCRDDNGFFDGQRIASLMLEKAALWFPLEAPSLDRDAIAALLETYLT